MDGAGDIRTRARLRSVPASRLSCETVAVAGAVANAVSVNIAVGDRLYYAHGPGYWVGPR